MYKRLAVSVCILACLIAARGVRAQTVFYSNTVDHLNYFPAGNEIAMPIAFNGTYEVDNFTFGYFLPLNDPNGNSTNAIVSFYTPGPDGAAFGDGTLISATEIDNLASDPTGNTNVVHFDLTTFGDFFNWTAMPLISGENGGWMSISFSNPDAGWELATGDSQDDFFQDMTNGNFYDFGGVANGDPQAAFYVQLSGQAIVPEPGARALLAGMMAPLGPMIYVLRRKRRR